MHSDHAFVFTPLADRRDDAIPTHSQNKSLPIQMVERCLHSDVAAKVYSYNVGTGARYVVECEHQHIGA